MTQCGNNTENDDTTGKYEPDSVIFVAYLNLLFRELRSHIHNQILLATMHLIHHESFLMRTSDWIPKVLFKRK